MVEMSLASQSLKRNISTAAQFIDFNFCYGIFYNYINSRATKRSLSTTVGLYIWILKENDFTETQFRHTGIWRIIININCS